jgi:hypothetical protein
MVVPNKIRRPPLSSATIFRFRDREKDTSQAEITNAFDIKNDIVLFINQLHLRRQ